jgi:crotonobetaine/carnitine-CoA ligase
VAERPRLRDRQLLVSAATFMRTDDDISSLLARRARALGQKPFVTFTQDPPEPTTDVTLSYREFDARVNQVARGLIELRIAKGDFVAVMLPNCVEFLEASYAIKRLGATEVAIGTGYAGPALARLIALTETATLITSSTYLESVLAVRSALPALRTIVLTDFDADRHTDSDSVVLRSFDSLVADDDSELGLPPPSYADLASILFTSGSTGLSKGVMLSHRCEVRYGDIDVALLDLTEDDILYTFYPLYNAGAALCELMPTLVAGGSAVIAPRFSARRLWHELGRHRATWFLMQGTVSKILWDQPPTADERNHNLRFAWATPLAGDRRAFEQRFGCEILVDDIYGASECGMLLPATPGTDGTNRIVHQVAIVDELDREVPQGSTGEIVVRGLEPYVMFDGYFGDPESTWARCRNLWYHTGDSGRLEADGRLTFLGRTGETIRSRGKNISALEIEDAVMGLESVAQCGVIGSPSEMGEDDIVAYVTLKEGHAASADEIVTHCQRLLPRYMVPHRLRFIDDMPISETGKIEKGKLRRMEAQAH